MVAVGRRMDRVRTARGHPLAANRGAAHTDHPSAVRMADIGGIRCRAVATLPRAMRAACASCTPAFAGSLLQKQSEKTSDRRTPGWQKLQGGQRPCRVAARYVGTP